MDRLRSGRFPPSGGKRARRPRFVGGGRPPVFTGAGSKLQH